MAYYAWSYLAPFSLKPKSSLTHPSFQDMKGLGPKDYLGILKSDQILYVRAIELGDLFENFEIFADSEPLQSLRITNR